jgi:hypothetical protein
MVVAPVDREGIVGPGVPHRNLTFNERLGLFYHLWNKLENGVLPRGAIVETSKIFSVHRKTVTRLWREGLATVQDNNDLTVDVSSRNKNSGRKPKYNQPGLNDAVKSIPIKERKNMRQLSRHLNVGLGTVHRMVHNPNYDGVLKPHTSAVRPSLTDSNKLERVFFCLEETGNDGRYKMMNNRIHIDEKWFYLKECCMRVYLAADEEAPDNETRHKGHILKVMFLCAVARPRFNPTTRLMWDGKIGIWPVIDWRAAQRSSRNRPRGTVEPHNVSFDGPRYKSMVLEHVLPAIEEKCPPAMKAETIYVQHDNASPHKVFKRNDADISNAMNALRLDIKPYYQPPNSPDLNILDLGFFRAIQAIHYVNSPRTTAELIASVKNSYSEYDSTKLNHCFLSLQSCMNEIIELAGGNRYRLPHMSKNMLERQGILPSSIVCTDDRLAWIGGDEAMDVDDGADDELAEL